MGVFLPVLLPDLDLDWCVASDPLQTRLGLDAVAAADLVVCRRDGQQQIYSLNTTVAQDVLAWLWDLLGGKPGRRKSP